MNAEGEVLHESGEKRTSETVAGFLASIAIFVSLVGLAWHPLRLILPSLAIALIASGMGSRQGPPPVRGRAHLRRLPLLRDDDRGRHSASRSGSDAALLQRTWTWDVPTSTG